MQDKKWDIIAHEYVVSLFPIFMMVDSFTKTIKQVLGKSCKFLAAKLENENVTYLHKIKDWKKVHDLLVNKMKREPKFLEYIFQNIETKGKKLVEFSRQVSRQNLKNKTAKQLLSLYNRYCKLNQIVYDYGLTIPILDFQKTTYLSDELNKILKQKVKSQQIQEYFSILTTPTRETFDKKEELELLKIIVKIKQSKKLISLFKKDTGTILKELKSTNLTINKRLDQHTKKYAWIIYVYNGPAADENYFVEIIKNYLEKKFDLKKEIRKIKKDLKDLKNKQRKYLDKLKTNKYQKKIAKLAKDVVFFKAYRRALQSQSYYYIEKLLSEIARRLNLTLKQVKMLFPSEVEIGLLKNKVNIDLINQRIKLVIFGRENGKKFELIDKKAEKFKKLIKEEKISKKIKILKGTCACAGKVKGIVKIINSPNEMEKMSNGDILISASTNPNLMPAIKKASAIVTDEGGLTCHAAIVSREFNIPCVVGTNIGTKVLKDKDKVEINATKGIVKKL